MGALALAFHPLTPDRWSDLERLFGARGACGGCWCMWWRLRRSEFDARKGEPNRRAFHEIVHSGAEPGILAYADGEPVGWCAVQPREAYPVLGRSRTLKPVDDQAVWSVTCFFVARGFRKRGVTTRLLRAAVEHARARGGRILEGYPIEPRKDHVPEAFAWTGFASAFKRAGFKEVARRSDTRPIMRYIVRNPAG
ncbi:MAG TPA: GNAT family N-acetyltransferase [Longimicrobium sp.]|jgi:GNAT superfamily N-acetyltransferase